MVANMMPNEIRTERLFLRPHRFADISDVLMYANDREWARFLPVPSPYTVRDAEEFLARSALADRVQHPDWAITLENRVVGGIDIRFMFEFRIAQLGYSIARALWSRGYATEAARAVIDAAFRCHAQLKRIRSYADTRNKGSIRVMEKIGMTYEGCLRSNRFVRDEFVDDAHYGILRDAWSERHA
jgi:ribosomal-protein-alanine N-acetyltransferase